MPKINISEFDLTKVNRPSYPNFTVLVPGPVHNSVDSVFDENGIYKCMSQAAFEKNVGLGNVEVEITPEIAAAEGVAPTVSVDPADVVTDEASFDSLLENEDKPLYIKELDAELDADSDGYNGRLHKGKYKYIPVAADADYDSSKNSFYCVIKSGNEGTDATKGETAKTTMQYGNRIAYELLGLGYTVLYKKIGSAADTSDAEDTPATASNAEETTLKTISNEEYKELCEAKFWDCLKDKSVYDLRYLISGFLGDDDEVKKQLISLADNRGDCLALLDIKSDLYDGKPVTATVLTDIKNSFEYKEVVENSSDTPTETTKLLGSKNAMYFAPYVEYDISSKTKYAYKDGSVTCYDETFPAGFHYLACAAKAFENFNEWYAVAGYARGVSPFPIKNVGANFGEIAVQELQPRYKKASNGCPISVNLITKAGDNYYLWGNRTAYELDVENEETKETGDLIASHFANIRQLCISLKKQIYIACRRATFDPNSELLWINFCNAIKPLLEKMKGDQGIEDYKIIKVKSNQRAMLSAKVRIVPIEAVEDFDIEIYLEDSLDGITIADDTQN